MWRYPKFFSCVIGLAVTILGFVGALILIELAGRMTGSSLVGMCGPHGPAAGVLGWLLVLSFPASIVAGIFAARLTHRHLTREKDET